MTDTWERRPRHERRAPVARRLTTRVAPRTLPRPAVEIALVLVAGFFVGWAGLAAGLALVALLRWRSVPSWWLQAGGAALLLVAMAVYLLVLGDARGTLSADGVARSMWPHWLAGAGLVIGLVGALRGAGQHDEMTPDD